jgi:hypothetical protein
MGCGLRLLRREPSLRPRTAPISVAAGSDRTSRRRQSPGPPPRRLRPSGRRPCRPGARPRHAAVPIGRPAEPTLTRRSAGAGVAALCLAGTYRGARRSRAHPTDRAGGCDRDSPDTPTTPSRGSPAASPVELVGARTRPGGRRHPPGGVRFAPSHPQRSERADHPVRHNKNLSWPLASICV